VAKEAAATGAAVVVGLLPNVDALMLWIKLATTPPSSSTPSSSSSTGLPASYLESMEEATDLLLVRATDDGASDECSSCSFYSSSDGYRLMTLTSNSSVYLHSSLSTLTNQLPDNFPLTTQLYQDALSRFRITRAPRAASDSMRHLEWLITNTSYFNISS
jgi:hypothetical protein